ncbi:hypothetical protein PENSPDRAFT_691838 [Peniophora sp. CONT]|nr:hypothetical protein PENSPDRAFT_691838 [Peniophora sp. CONT]
MPAWGELVRDYEGSGVHLAQIAYTVNGDLGDDHNAGEVEIGICSTADDEPEEGRGLWRTMDEEEIEKHLLAYAEKD